MKGLQKKQLTPLRQQINELKDEIRECQTMMKSCRTMFEMADDDNLIEARIYQMMSLSKHYDYLMGRIRQLTFTGEPRRDKTAVNV